MLIANPNIYSNSKKYVKILGLLQLKKLVFEIRARLGQYGSTKRKRQTYTCSFIFLLYENT